MDNYSDIKKILKEQTLILNQSISITNELNKLWESTSSNVDILEFFKENEDKLPRVSIIARVFLVNFTSESICERMFSESGCFLSKRQNRLSSDHFECKVINKMNSDN